MAGTPSRSITLTGTLALAVSALAATTAVRPTRPPQRLDPYRAASQYVLDLLQLQPGQVVVDIGAGDGWWSAKMAQVVGQSGRVHAAEVKQELVDQMKKRYADQPQLRPYLCPYDNTGLAENTCDLAFLSKTFHHIAAEVRLDYLRHLRRVIRPAGRLVLVERYQALARGRGKAHSYDPALLIQQAQQAGWLLQRCQLLPGCDHFIAIFTQQNPRTPSPAQKPDPHPSSHPAPTTER